MATHITQSIDIKYKKVFDDDVDWMTNAACKGLTELFYEPHNEKKGARDKRETAARAVCKTCPVAIECREFARRNGEYGIWGDELEIDRYRAGYIKDVWMRRRLRAEVNRNKQRENGITSWRQVKGQVPKFTDTTQEQSQ